MFPQILASDPELGHARITSKRKFPRKAGRKAPAEFLRIAGREMEPEDGEILMGFPEGWTDLEKEKI